MKSPTSINNLENSSPKSLFQRDLIALHGFYSDEILNLVGKNIDQLLPNYIAWQEALITMARNLKVDSSNPSGIPNIIEQATYNKVKSKFSIERPKKIVLGMAGPGAVGKETIQRALGYDKVINTTTRPKRDYENTQYRFIDSKKFNEIRAENGFIISTDRLNRGQYGIQKQDIENVLLRSRIILVEENPVNLTSLENYIKNHGGYEFVLIYILPPSPILPHLAARLAGRVGNDFQSTITSTLGTRQLNEFNSVSDSITKGLDIIFLVNDKVERVVKKIKNLVE